MNDKVLYNQFMDSLSKPTPESKIFHELIGRYQGSLSDNGVTTDNVVWDTVNQCLDELIKMGYSHYERFKVQPTRLGPRDNLNFGTLRTQLMGALQRMSQDFELSDPTYLIYEHMPKQNTSINNSASNANIQTTHQTQQQSQQTTLTVNQRVELIEKTINENLSQEQIDKIKPILEEYKQNPNKWSSAQKLISGVLEFGKDIASNVIANIITNYT